MNSTLVALDGIIQPTIAADEPTYHEFRARLAVGHPTRTEDAASHFCVFFLPFNPEAQQVFLVHHKKAGSWISPGGHIDPGETPWATLNREIKEELGVTEFFRTQPQPFFLTIKRIENPLRTCKAHYDIWFLAPTDGHNFHIDPTEFHATRWMTLDEADAIVTDTPNRCALQKLRGMTCATPPRGIPPQSS